MKKLFVLTLTLITIYSIYYDLNFGTLPLKVEATNTVVEENTPGETNSEYIEVLPGYTVLTIVEQLHHGPVNASIQQIITDFEYLNPGTNASMIQTGTSYYFPTYYSN